MPDNNITKQCVISITRDGKTVVKLTAGCNEDKFQQVVEAIESLAEEDAESVYAIAETIGLGCKDCLQAMDKKRSKFKGKDVIPARYRLSFHDAPFNPRYELLSSHAGKAGNVKIIQR